MLSEEIKLICKEVKTDLAFVCFLFDFLAGAEGLEPNRHPVLETGALPTELYPYIDFQTGRTCVMTGNPPCRPDSAIGLAPDRTFDRTCCEPAPV